MCLCLRCAVADCASVPLAAFAAFAVCRHASTLSSSELLSGTSDWLFSDLLHRLQSRLFSTLVSSLTSAHSTGCASATASEAAPGPEGHCCSESLMLTLARGAHLCLFPALLWCWTPIQPGPCACWPGTTHGATLSAQNFHFPVKATGEHLCQVSVSLSPFHSAPPPELTLTGTVSRGGHYNARCTGWLQVMPILEARSLKPKC